MKIKRSIFSTASDTYHLLIRWYLLLEKGFPGDISGKEPTCQFRRRKRCRFDPWGRPLGGRHGNPLQYSCLENLMDRGSWWATVHGVTKESDRTEQLILRFILYLLFITFLPSCPPSISPPLPLSFFPFNSWIITTSKQMASLPSGVPGQRMIHQAP